MRITLEMMMRKLDFILDCQVLKFSRKHLTLLPHLWPVVQQHLKTFNNLFWFL